MATYKTGISSDSLIRLFEHSVLVVCGVLVLAPSIAFAAGPASFSAAQSLLATSSSPGNAYTAGGSVIVTAPTVGDLLITGGSIVAAGPVGGDMLLIGGSISGRAAVKGDVRAIGGTINITERFGGDLVAIGYTVNDAGRSGGSVFIIAANTTLSNGAAGPVTIYANNVALSGDFASDVRIVSTGSITLMGETMIRGKLSYEGPEKARIASTATVIGGIEYTNASYLPDVGASRMLSIASIGVFLLIRVLGALLLAGLLAGLFPDLARAVTDRIYMRRLRSILLTTLLGFAALAATPILLVMLALTFVGFGIAVLLFLAYALLVILACTYSGILVGVVFMRRFARRETVLWHDGVLGMLILTLIALFPFVGLATVLLLAAFTAGSLLIIFFESAFPQEEHTAELL